MSVRLDGKDGSIIGMVNVTDCIFVPDNFIKKMLAPGVCNTGPRYWVPVNKPNHPG